MRAWDSTALTPVWLNELAGSHNAQAATTDEVACDTHVLPARLNRSRRGVRVLPPAPHHPAGPVPGLTFVSIERECSGLLHGRRVDMVTPKFLNPRIREQVLSSAEALYVAA